MSAEARLASLNLQLPPAPKPVGVYKPALVIGNLCYVSGHGPLNSDGTLHTGKVGEKKTKLADSQLPNKRDWPSSRLLRTTSATWIESSEW